MTQDTQRLTPERLAEIRADDAAMTRSPFPVYQHRRDLLTHLDAVTRERDEARGALVYVDRNSVLGRCYGFRSALGPNRVEDGLCEQRECARCWRKRSEQANRERDDQLQYTRNNYDLYLAAAAERDGALAALATIAGTTDCVDAEPDEIAKHVIGWAGGERMRDEDYTELRALRAHFAAQAATIAAAPDAPGVGLGDER